MFFVTTFKKLMVFLNRREKLLLIPVVGIFIVVGFVELLGVASIMPFILILSNPGVVETNPTLARVHAMMGAPDTQTFNLIMGLAVFGVFVFGIVAKAVSLYVTTRYTAARNFTVAQKMLAGYLAQPYVWFLDRHSSHITKSVLNEVSKMVNGSLTPLMRLIAQSVLAVFVLGLLVVIDPVVAMSAAVLVVGIYGSIVFFLRKRLRRLSETRFALTRRRFRVTAEALGGVKEVKVMSLERGYAERFRKPSQALIGVTVQSQMIAALPRYLLDLVMFGGMLTLLLVMIARNDGSLQATLPTLALYAVAGTRLLPAVQSIYRDYTTIRFSAAALDNLLADFLEAEGRRIEPAPRTPLGLKQAVAFERVGFSYPSAERPALRDFSLTIPARTTVGVVGGTGAGKTTAVDLLLGLLEPDEGRILIDGQPLGPDNVRAWQQSIGYVPQQIYLLDESVAANIAFGVPADQIDHAAVERAARAAHLHDFVTEHLPKGYGTLVGERGVRLSGGQRQRIGIARALYHDPDVLVFDEATSALDNVTESAVMEAVHGLARAKTIVMIAHRLSTVRACDTLILLENGRLAAQGDYDTLVETSPAFRAMVEGRVEVVDAVA